jgi:hypothetical protein
MRVGVLCSFVVVLVLIRREVVDWWGMAAATATLRWVLQLHRDVPRAARFYSEGLDFSVNVCTLRWAELQSGPLKLALMHTNDRCGYCCFLPRSRRSIIQLVLLRASDGCGFGVVRGNEV